MSAHRNRFSPLTRLLRGLATCAIAIQMLVPVGYMPGALAAGTPFVLCDARYPMRGHDDMAPSAAAQATPDTTAHTQPATAAGHGHDAMHAAAATLATADRLAATDSAATDGSVTAPEHDEHTGSQAWENCPLGALGASAALAVTFEPVIAPPVADRIAAHFTILRTAVRTLTARARAPPAAAAPAVRHRFL